MKTQPGLQFKLNKRLLQDEIANNAQKALDLQKSIEGKLSQINTQMDPGDLTSKIYQIMMAEAIKFFPADKPGDNRVCNNKGFKTGARNVACIPSTAETTRGSNGKHLAGVEILCKVSCTIQNHESQSQASQTGEYPECDDGT